MVKEVTPKQAWHSDAPQAATQDIDDVAYPTDGVETVAGRLEVS